MRIVSFRGTTLPANMGVYDLGVAARSGLVQLPGGAFDQDGSNVVLQANTITATFQIAATVQTTMDSIMATLAKGRGLLKVLMQDGTTYRQTWAKFVRVARQRNINNLNALELSVEFERNYPYWIASADEPVYLDDGEVLNDGWYLDAGNYTQTELDTFNSTSDKIEINNTGGARIPVRILIEATAATGVQNLRIWNEMTDQWIAYTGTIVTGDVIEIDSRTKTIKVNDVDAYSTLIVGPDQVDWMDLEIGNNNIYLYFDPLVTDDDIFVTIYWSKHYL